MTDKGALSQRHCKPCEGGVSPMTPEETNTNLEEVKEWELTADGKAIRRRFRFRNFHETMVFINAMAEIANTQDHHPDFSAGYNYCEVCYTTHAIGGLSENDFICAARVNALL
jgi:4a-hydroxytetrahydrobiopterin dehydratase